MYKVSWFILDLLGFGSRFNAAKFDKTALNKEALCTRNTPMNSLATSQEFCFA